METVARRVQCIVDAYAQGGSASPDWGNAKLFTGYVGPDDLVMPQLKSWAARKGKEEVELFQRQQRKQLLLQQMAAYPQAATPSPNAVLEAKGWSRRQPHEKRGGGEVAWSSASPLS